MKNLKRVSIGIFAILMCSNLYAAKNSTVTGSLEIADSANVATASNSVAGSADGEAVTFNATVDGRLAKQSILFVSLVCRQHGYAVYQNASATDYTFNLDDSSGLWNTSEAAECTADLIYRTTNGKQNVNYYLDTMRFTVDGHAV